MIRNPYGKLTEKEGRITLNQPAKVCSTNVEALREELFHFIRSEAVKMAELQVCHFDFSQTRMVDSLGLNLIFELLQWAKNRGLSVSAEVTHRPVYLVFLNVRLDKQMEIKFAPRLSVALN